MDTSVYRNLAEQVQKNKEDILKHFQRDKVLADFGIRIIGQVDTPEELPESAAEYGDAYAVGTQSPFNYYIWTRANNISPVDYWFAFGEIAIAGPKGPKGDKGDKGETGQSTYWISILTLDYLDLEKQNIPLDTMVLEYGTGNVYQVLLVNGVKTFDYQMNIKGATGDQGPRGPKGYTGEPGPQGPKGDTGDVGGFINIAGVVSSYEALPDPELIDNLTVAYLVGTAEPYDLYIQVGSNSRVATWLNAGPLNVATMVTAGGQYQNTWDADTKLDKITAPTPNNQAYVKSYNGAQSLVDISQTPSAWKIVSYDGEGQLKTNTPTADNDCASKGYVDDSVNTRVKSYSGSNTYKEGRWLYGLNGIGGKSEDFLMIVTQPDGTTQINDRVTNASIAAYNFGCLSGRDPVKPYNYATKNYVDNAISTSGPITVPIENVIMDWDGEDSFYVPEQDFIYRISPSIFANYGLRDEFYYIQLEPVTLPVYLDRKTYAVSRIVSTSAFSSIPDPEALKGLELSFTHDSANGTEILMHLNEPQGLRDDWINTELSLDIIVETLY